MEIQSFGYWVRRQRKALDLTQQALADRVGCSLAAIKKIEGEERRPSRQIAERMADIFGVQKGQREVFIEVARGIRPVDQLFQPNEPTTVTYVPKINKPLHNLPVQLTSFIGRKQELAEAKLLLTKSRLLTLIGPGGTGKTRLAIQIGQEVMPDFANGVWMVELAQLADPALIPQTIASVFELREVPKMPLKDILINYLRSKQLLLILDNCEHLVAACAVISVDLLSLCPKLKILVSSRESLGISGETVYRVPSLSLPSPAQGTPEVFMQSEAVQLLSERARAVQPHFVLEEPSIPAITQICQRLDGIPLALELAAARMAVLSVEEIAARLDDRFRLLTGGSRTALERHQTLRALIDWSYDLLTAEEQLLFRQLSVFAGGWTYSDAEAVFPDLDVLNLLTQLVNKSMVMVDEHMQGRRYRLPETIRQYARDKLLDSGEAASIRDRHLQFFLRFVEEAEPKLRGHEQIQWLNNLEAEHDNLRAALSWSIESKKTAQALKLVGALYYFWGFRGYWTEGKKWIDDALALSEHDLIGNVGITEPEEEMFMRAKALYASSWMDLLTTGAETAHRKGEASLSLWRKLGNKWWTAVTLEFLGLLFAGEGDFPTARERVEEGVILARESGDNYPLAVCLVRLGDSLKGKDVKEARRFLEEGIAVARVVGDRSVLSEGLRELGSACFMQGDLTTAMESTQGALAEARAIQSLVQVALALFQLSVIACFQNDRDNAMYYCTEFYELGKDNWNPFVLLLTPLGFGLIAIYNGQPEIGVRLIAASEAIALKYGAKLNVEGEMMYIIFHQALEKARQQLDQADFEKALQEGASLTLEQALALITEWRYFYG